MGKINAPTRTSLNENLAYKKVRLTDDEKIELLGWLGYDAPNLKDKLLAEIILQTENELSYHSSAKVSLDSKPRATHIKRCCSKMPTRCPHRQGRK